MAKNSLLAHWFFWHAGANVFGSAPFETQLHCAYVDFKSYCMRRGKRTTIDDFSKKELKITSLLG